MKKIIIAIFAISLATSPVFSQKKKTKKEVEKTVVQEEIIEEAPPMMEYSEEMNFGNASSDGGDFGSISNSYDEEKETIVLDAEGKYSLIKTKSGDYGHTYSVVSKDGKILIPSEIRNYYILENGNFLFTTNGNALLYSSKMVLLNYLSGSVEKMYNGNLYTVYMNNNRKIYDENFEDIFKNYKGNNDLVASIKNIGVLTNENDRSSQNLFFVSNGDEYSSPKSAVYNKATNKFITPFIYSRVIAIGENILGSKTTENYNSYFNVDILNNEGKVLKTYKKAQLNRNRLIVENENGKVGLIGSDLNEIIPFEYDNIEIANQDGGSTFIAKKGNESFLFDELGSQILDKSYTKIQVSYNNRIIVKQNNKFGILTLFGKSIVPTEYDSIFANNSNFFLLKGKSWEIISNEGIKLTTEPFDNIEMNGRVMLLKKGTKYAILSQNGDAKLIKPNFIYDEIKTVNYNSYIVKVGLKYSIIKQDYNENKQSAAFDEIIPTAVNDTYIVRTGTKYGIVSNLNVLKACTYDMIIVHEDYSDGNYAKGVTGGKEEKIRIPKNSYY